MYVKLTSGEIPSGPSEPSTQEQQAPRPDMTLEDAKVMGLTNQVLLARRPMFFGVCVQISGTTGEQYYISCTYWEVHQPLLGSISKLRHIMRLRGRKLNIDETSQGPQWGN